MKRVINGVACNTRTAALIHTAGQVSLYQGTTGGFFLQGAGRVRRVEPEAARRWLAATGAGNKLPDGNPACRVTLRLPPATYQRACAKAEAAGLPVSRYIIKVLEETNT